MKTRTDTDSALAALESEEEISESRFLRRTVLVVSLIIFTGLVLTLIWYASDVFLVLFAGILLAVLLRAPTNWLTANTRLSEHFALSLSISVLILVLIMLAYLFAVPMGSQIGQLIDTVPQGLAQLRKLIRQYDWAKPFLPLVSEISRLRIDSHLLGRAGGLITSTMSGLGGAIVALFLGIYMAAQPRLYQRGFMHLLPRKRRPRAYEVLDEIGSVLRRWLVGRMITMAAVGIAASIGLWMLNVPLAFTLGILSGLLEFVAYIGPIMAAIPAVLIAFNLDPLLALYVLSLYAAIQAAENYLLTPLVEQRAVALPPALVIFTALLLGVLAGPLGVILASPLTATGIVAVKLLYVEDVVEQPAKSL
ncbi:MAG TPA: AI-2E family transporter [Noviherbaspirillum sp.]|nr:AI-2E family transporter [Noviherbaspirillum sp.]